MDKKTAAQLVRFLERFHKEQPLYELSAKSLLMPYIYNRAIVDFISFCSDNHLITPACYTIVDELLANIGNAAWFEQLTEEQVIQSIGVIIRQDRFIDGLIAQSIKDLTLIRLLTRVKVLYNL